MKKQALSFIASMLLASIGALPPLQCSNSALFQIEDGTRTLTCNQIESEERDRIRFCQNRDVRDKCPRACGVCCDDSPMFTFQTKNGSTKNCEWLGRQIRSFLYCDTEDKNGIRISDSCPKVCNKCKPYVKDNIPEYLLDLSQAPISQTTLPPTSSPPPTVSECKDDLYFRFNDKPFESCKRIRRTESIRQELCSNEDVVRTACPLTCGICCADDEDFTFLSRNKKRELTCSSLNSEFKQLKNCDRFENGKLVKTACRRTCNFCMERIAKIDNITDDRIDGPIAGASGQEITDKSKLPVFLGLSISFILFGIILLAFFLVRKKRHSKWDEKNDSTINVGDTETIVGSGTDMDKIETTVPYSASFIAPNFANLGNKKNSQIDVHKCPEFRPHFDCHECEHKEHQVEFIKVPKVPVARKNNKNILSTIVE